MTYSFLDSTLAFTYDPNTMEKLQQYAEQAARAAGAAIMSQYRTLTAFYKDDDSPVTKADHDAHDLIMDHLMKTNIPILSEEGESCDLPYPKELWITDPLDGTKDFLQETGDFSVMIALIREGKPVLGVVYAPAYDKLYSAIQGKGAFVEDNSGKRPLRVSDRPASQLRFLCSNNHYTPLMEHVASSLAVEAHIPRGSGGIKAGLLGEGAGDFFFYAARVGEWDVGAPEIIVREAGGVVSDLTGNQIHYGNLDHRIARGALFANSKENQEIILNALANAHHESTTGRDEDR